MAERLDEEPEEGQGFDKDQVEIAKELSKSREEADEALEEAKEELDEEVGS